MAVLGQRSPSVFRFGMFELDVSTGELRRAGRRVKLQEQPREVLLTLVENAGSVVTREELRERLWPNGTFVDFDHSLNIAINKIRDALDDVATSPRFVETIPRRGYRFLVPVEQVEQLPRSQRRHSLTSSGDVHVKWTNRLVVGGLVAILVVTSGVLVGWRLTRPQPEPHTIAVLPFTNLSVEPDSDYFTDGLTDEIIRNFSLIEGLRVISRTSSFEFKGKPRNIRDVGKRLDADLVLEGAVRRADGRMRITADLVRVADDATIWSERYDRDVADVFAIEDDISRAIVNELRLKNVGGQRRYQTNLEAYDSYLRAETLAKENSPGNDLALQNAINLFQQVIAKDRGFAPAFAGISDAYAHLRNRGRSLEASWQMRDAAGEAIRLDPLLPEGHAALGLVHASGLAWSDADQAFRRSIQLNPNLARVREDFATFVLQPEGKQNEAVQQLRKAVELDPLSPSRRLQLAFALLRQASFEKAGEIAQGVVAAHPADPFARQLYARALLLEGKPHDAIAILEKQGPASHGYLGYAYARIGRRSEAEQLAVENDPAMARHQVLIYTALGEADRVFDALYRLADRNDFMADLYPAEPELASLRDDPRMKEFRRTRNLQWNP